MRRSWQETFGLLLGLVWACTGLYIISLFYRQDFNREVITREGNDTHENRHELALVDDPRHRPSTTRSSIN